MTRAGLATAASGGRHGYRGYRGYANMSTTVSNPERIKIRRLNWQAQLTSISLAQNGMIQNGMSQKGLSQMATVVA